MAEFLDVPETDMYSSLLAQISKGGSNDTISLSKDEVKAKNIKPIPGFCIKTKSEENNAKVFINVCHCSEIPTPRDVTESQLTEILQSMDPSSFRIPLSIGEAHEEKDKQGQSCNCYDVVISTDFFLKTEKSELFQSFLITLCYESVKDKYDLDIKRESCVVLKQKTYFGNMPNHYVQAKPLIAELGSEKIQGKEVSVKAPNFRREKNKKGSTLTPKYTLRKKPASGAPLLLTLEIALPNVSTGENVSVSVGEDRVVIYEPKYKYELDIFVPHLVAQKSCAAQFDVCQKVLHILMPVAQ